MKKISVSFLMFLFATACPLLIAQQPTAVGGKGVATGHPQTPPATGPMLNLANHLVDAINKQDTATLQKMLASDAVYLDEDGHAPPARVWINKLATGTPAKQIAISATHSQMWDDAGWVSFNYTLAESLQGQPKTCRRDGKHRGQENGKRRLANSTHSRSLETESRWPHSVGRSR
jgi:hypothetical protein